MTAMVTDSRPQSPRSSPSTTCDRIAAHGAARWTSSPPIGIKVNLYRAFEVAALAAVTAEDPAAFRLECVMVGDSYLMTHLGRSSTRLETPSDREWALDLMVSLVSEVRDEMDRVFAGADAPYLLGDLPEGATETPAKAVESARRMVDAGAEAIKVEIADDHTLATLERLSESDVPIVAHLGYTPQGGQLRRHGDSLPDALAIFALARRARDAGAFAIVLEMVSEVVNRALSCPREGALLTYSIFSGRAPYGGQSLNVWDAVFRRSRPSKYFPPTADLTVERDRELYAPPLIAAKLGELLHLTLAGEFPLSPPARMEQSELEAVLGTDPWAAPPPSGPVNGRAAGPGPRASATQRRAASDDELESSVRTYCRKFPAVFTSARHHLVWDEHGREYVDFLCGAGALNYGHNHPDIVGPMVEYIGRDGIVHGMDLATSAKREFMRALEGVILKPRGLNYRLQFTGPTGTNAVEAAFKVARRVTGRTGIVAFTNGFHGMSLGALAATGNSFKRAGAGVPLAHVTRMPYDGYLGDGVDTLDLLASVLDDPGSGVDLPAAVIVETVQGEGGVNVATPKWLRRLEHLAHARGILLIVDEIQTGCGRTGKFFSFEESGLQPDLVCLSKSLGGIGLPVAMVLIKPELDQQQPGEHSGTFRGNNLAFVAGTAALSMWTDPRFEEQIESRAAVVEARLGVIARDAKTDSCEVRGRGLLRGLRWSDRARAARVSQAAFEMGVLVETCGSFDDVLKVMPPLTIELGELRRGLDLLGSAVAAT
jgi:diaminobutyrate-2-oxoglutarate transaminase